MARRAGATVLRPFEVAADRVSRPFRDAYGYFAGLVHAKSENNRLRSEVEKLRQSATLNLSAASENADLRKKLHFVKSSSYPKGYDYVTAPIIAQPPAAFEQQVTVSAGSSSGIRLFDPVVTGEGLVGTVVRVAESGLRRGERILRRATIEVSRGPIIGPSTSCARTMLHAWM